MRRAGDFVVGALGLLDDGRGRLVEVLPGLDGAGVFWVWKFYAARRAAGDRQQAAVVLVRPPDAVFGDLVRAGLVDFLAKLSTGLDRDQFVGADRDVSGAEEELGILVAVDVFEAAEDVGEVD